MAAFSFNMLSWLFSHSIFDHGSLFIQYVLIADFSICSHGSFSQSIFSHGIFLLDIIAVFSIYIFLWHCVFFMSHIH